MLILNKDNFKQEVFQEDIRVIVYFWSNSCTFCRMMKPYVDEVEDQYEGRYKFCKVDIEKEEAITALYDVDTTPTLLLMDCGDVVAKAIGVLMPRYIVEELKLEELPPQEAEE